jgi:hypothetical protein
MALQIKLTNGPGTTTYTLKVERVQHQMQRTPTTVACPGDSGTGQPQVIQVDFGYCLEVITFQGVVDRDGTTEGTDVYPPAADLRTAVRTWWKDADYAAGTGLIKLTTWTGEAYYGTFRGFNLQLVSGREDRYEFSIDFQVKSSA